MAQKNTNPLNYPRYVRGLRPALPESLATYVEDELEKVQNSLDNAAKAAFDEVEAARAEIADTNAKVDKIGEDAFLHPAEKLVVVREYADITRVYQNADARAATLGITTERTAATTAYNALTSYLNGLSPAWNDTSQVTAIDRVVWNAKWDDVFAALEALWSKISTEDASRSLWTGVSGTGKPQDNATVGATIGTNLSGQFTSSNVPTFFANASIGNLQIGGVLQSDNYVPGVSGWKIDKTGATLAEFNGIVLSRDLILGSGTVNIGPYGPVSGSAGTIIIDTGIAVSSWDPLSGPLAVSLGFQNTEISTLSGDEPNTYWEARPKAVFARNRYSGTATICIEVEIVGHWQSLAFPGSGGAAAAELTWKVYDVT